MSVTEMVQLLAMRVCAGCRLRDGSTAARLLGLWSLADEDVGPLMRVCIAMPCLLLTRFVTHMAEWICERRRGGGIAPDGI